MTQNREGGITDRHRRILRDVLRQHGERIERVGVFGSRAVGTARPNSDFDIIIHGKVDQALLDRLWTEFSESALEVSVDVVGDGLIAYAELVERIRTTERPLFEAKDLVAM